MGRVIPQSGRLCKRNICAGCKKIRRDDGSSQTLERHFAEGSLAQFSHGLCGGCVTKYYNEQ